jgi:hypothetical protein
LGGFESLLLGSLKSLAATGSISASKLMGLAKFMAE